jgi:hypothetical protein
LTLIEGNGDLARTEGTLRITDQCVFLESAEQLQLLAWPAAQTRWNAGDGTIAFTTGAGENRVLTSGEALALGGSGADFSDDREAWMETWEWVVRPAPRCLTDATRAWAITDVE